MSPAFDPDLHLARIGVANQTTMLARESLAIGEEIGNADRARARRRRARRELPHLRHDLQRDAGPAGRREELLAEPLDVMLVVGGYNSSNTISLAAICAEHVTTYHIEDAEASTRSSAPFAIRPIGRTEERPNAGCRRTASLRVGLTAGASTPNNKIGDTVARVFASRGIDPATIS